MRMRMRKMMKMMKMMKMIMMMMMMMVMNVYGASYFTVIKKCFRPYQPYMFWEDMILAMCHPHHMTIII